MRLLACVTRGPSREPYRKHGLFHERTSGARVCGPSFRKDSHVAIVYDPLPYNSYTKNLYTSEWTVRSGHIPYSWTIIQWIGSLNSCQNHLSNSKSVLAGASLNVPIFFWSWAASLSLTRDDYVTLHQRNREWRRQATPTVSTPRPLLIHPKHFCLPWEKRSHHCVLVHPKVDPSFLVYKQQMSEEHWIFLWSSSWLPEE